MKRIVWTFFLIYTINIYEGTKRGIRTSSLEIHIHICVHNRMITISSYCLNNYFLLLLLSNIIDMSIYKHAKIQNFYIRKHESTKDGICVTMHLYLQ